MDHSVEVPPSGPSLSESIRRKSSLSEKLNKLTGNPFNRRRISAALTASESSTSLHRKSRLPTPSSGSRTSSLFGSLRLSNADDSDSTGTPKNNRKGSQDARSVPSSTRNSRLASGSTSSFFGNNNSETLYPKGFLENAEPQTVWKENDTQSSLPRASSQGASPTLGPRHAMDQGLEIPGPDTAKPSDIDTATPVTKRSSRSVSSRLAKGPFCRLHFAPHSLAAVPQSSSSRPKDRDPNAVIEERRLMAPINPPLTRSSTMNVGFNTSLAPIPYQFSPRTPNFLRPTSSSATRRTGSLKAIKSPPTPLDLPRCSKSDMVGFAFHRKKLVEARGKSQASERRQDTHSGLPSETGSQWPPEETLDAIPERAPSTCETSTENTTRLRRKAMTPCKIPTPTFNKQTNANLRNSQGDSTVLKKNYAHNSRYASSQELRDSFETNLPPMPPLPRRATSSTTEIHEQNTALAAFEREHHPIKQSKEQESYFAADSPFYSASHGRLSRVVRPNSGVFGRPSTVVPLQGSQQREGDDPVSTMPMKFSVSSGLSNGNGSVYSRQATASRIPQSSSRPAGLQATQYCQKPFRTNQQSVNGDRGVALPRPSLGRAGSSRSSLIDKPLPALPSSSTAQSVFPPRKTSLQPSSLSHSLFSSVRLDNNVNIEETPPLSHDGDNTSGQVSATSISEPSHANPAAPVNSTAKNEDEEGDISLVHEDQDLRYWAGRFTAIDDHICNDATFSRDAQWAHNVTLRHNHVLQLLHEKCRTRAAQDSLTSFTRAWSGGWSGGVRGVYRGGVVLPPRNFLLEEQKKKNGLMGKVFGRKKSKD